MKKLMFFTNNVFEVNDFAQFFDSARKHGFEPSIGTYNIAVVMLASYKRMLVVKPDTYHYHFIVHKDTEVPAGLRLRALKIFTWEEMMGTVHENDQAERKEADTDTRTPNP